MKPQDDPALIRERYETQLGENRIVEKLEELCGVNRATVFRWFAGGFPPHAVTILQLLEACPKAAWPTHIRALARRQ